jgi:HEAT repeat protein
MAPPDDRRPLSGIARSIDALFGGADEDGEPSDSGSEPAPEPPAGDAAAGSPAVDPPEETPTAEATETRAAAERSTRQERGRTSPSVGDADLFMDVEMVPRGESAEDGGPPASVSGTDAGDTGGSGATAGAESRADELEFRAEVHRYIVSEGHREDRAEAVRARAWELLDRDRVDPVTDGAQRLALAADGDDPRSPVLALARDLLTVRVVDRLVARLAGVQEELRRTEMVQACARLGEPVAEEIVASLPEATSRTARRSFVEALVGMGRPGADAATTLVGDDRWYVVRNGLYVMGEVAHPASVPTVAATLDHPHPKVRREALLALAKMGGEDAGHRVHGHLDDPEPDVRVAAAMAAGALRLELARRPLQEMLKEEDDPDVQVAQIRALGRLGDAAAVPTLESKVSGSLFSRPPTEVRVAAFRALAAIGTPRARKLLHGAVNDRDVEVRETVRELIGGR